VEKETARSDSEIEKRRDTALLRALSTPHKKQADMKKGAKNGSAQRRRAKEKSPEQGPGSKS
jgi:hypothetical protein